MPRAAISDKERLGDVLYADKSKVRVPEEEWLKLIRAIAGGDQLALHSLFERTNRIVFTLIVRIVMNRETAEEVTLDTSMTCGEKRRRTTLLMALSLDGS